MTRYLARKLISLPFTVLAVSLIIFGAVRLLPGDPARLIAGPEASSAAVAQIHSRLGLDRPFVAQYCAFLIHAASGDLGVSIESRRPVMDELASHAPFTLMLGLTAYLLAVAVGVPGGIFAAASPGGLWDKAFSSLTTLSVSVANFWVGLMAMELFAVQLQWLPLMGAGSPSHLVLPALTLALMPIGLVGKMTRASMIDILSKDYIRTARAKGLSDFVVFGRHALRNALTPIVTIVGLNLGSVIGGAVVTETVFSWPGLGRLLVDAVRFRDYPVIQGVTLFAVVSVVIANLIAELTIGLLDPRLRHA